MIFRNYLTHIAVTHMNTDMNTLMNTDMNTHMNTHIKKKFVLFITNF